MKTIIALLVLATLAISVSARGQKYAVLLAGSNGFGNYRHQADVYHTYQILINGGVPAENIITLAYNDIANNRRNPFPGKVYNHNSGNLPGVDVYEGIKIDYEGQDVTTANYLAILKGDKSGVKGGNGRVLESTADDEVFLFYSDHGAPGFVGMPVGKDLYADDLLATLKFMKDNSKFNRLYYVLNACHSGSMFESLPNDWNIIAITAANKSQSGWGTFCPPHDHINGKSLGSCLSSQFPAAFTVNSDIINTNKETYDLQFQLIAKSVVSSEVQQWGDLEYGKKHFIADSIGGENQQAKPIQDPSLFFPNTLKTLQESLYSSDDSADEQKHLEMKYLMNKYQQEPTEENYHELNDDLMKSKKFARVFEHFASRYGLTGEIAKSTHFGCYKQMVEDLRHQCGELNDFSRHLVKYFHHYCNVKDYEPHHHQHCFSL